MGFSYRIILVDDDDNVKLISNARFERITSSGLEALSEYAGKRLRYALVVVEVKRRELLEIRSVYYSVLPLDKNGQIDQAESDREGRLVAEMLAADLYPPETADNVIDAQGVLANMSYATSFRWQPTADLERRIRNEVFAKKPPRSALKKNRVLTLVKPIQ